MQFLENLRNDNDKDKDDSWIMTMTGEVTDNDASYTVKICLKPIIS